jgi:hypothetical protein
MISGLRLVVVVILESVNDGEKGVIPVRQELEVEDAVYLEVVNLGSFRQRRGLF